MSTEHQQIVVWTEEKAGILVDHWEVLEPEDAKFKYDELLRRDDTYSASICEVVESTDYEASPLLEAATTLGQALEWIGEYKEYLGELDKPWYENAKALLDKLNGVHES